MLAARSLALAGAILALASGSTFANPSTSDPMRSPVWSSIAATYLPGAPVVFDDRVKVVVPVVVENQAQVPVAADARALGVVEKLIVIADLNPIQQVLALKPSRLAPYIAFRMKVEQGTPIRAAALSNGVWHVGSTYLDAMGGGCSAPAAARKNQNWSSTVGHSQGRLWREADGEARVRFRIRHPMDTGLARDNTPAYFIERIALETETGAALGEIESYEPLSEDPTLTLSLSLPASEQQVVIKARDNNGGVFRSVVQAWPRQAATAPIPSSPR